MQKQQLVPNFDETYIKQLMINGFYNAFIGETGSGKTISLTWFAYKINRVISNMDIKLFSNYHFKGDYWDYKYMEHPDEMLKIRFGFAFTDDMWRWCLDSYDSHRKALKKYDELQGVGRKRGISVFASSQRFGRLDINFRYNVHYLVCPETYLDIHNIPYLVSITVLNNQVEIRGRKKVEYEFGFNPIPIFDMYETSEEIESFDTLHNIDYSGLAKEFIKDWEEPDNLPTQSRVDLFLNDKGIIYDFTENERKILKQYIWRTIKKRILDSVKR